MLIMSASCDSKARLSEEVQGVWGSAPEQIQDTGAEQATLVRLMEFNASSSAQAEGTVTMTALITVENTMPANDSIVAPLEITASGTATISGYYQAIDDDELAVTLDASSLTVSVDPQAVQLNYNALTTESSAQVDKLKPAAAMLASQQIRRAAQNTFYTLNKIDDIKINNKLMSCEIGKHDLTFRRQVAE